MNVYRLIPCVCLFLTLLLSCSNNSKEPETISIEQIELDKNSIKVEVGETFTLKAHISPEGYTPKGSIIWKESSNESVIYPNNQKGSFTAISSGQAVIEASLDGAVDYCKVEVVGKKLSLFELNVKNKKLYVGEEFQLKERVQAPDGLYYTISRWYSSNPSIVSVDQNGLIKAIKAGTAEVSLELLTSHQPIRSISDTYVATCVVTVLRSPVESVGVTEYIFDRPINTIELGVGESLRCNATTQPADAIIKSVAINHKPSNVFEIQDIDYTIKKGSCSSFRIRALNPGEDFFSVEVQDEYGNEVNTSVTVVVKPFIPRIRFSKTIGPGSYFVSSRDYVELKNVVYGLYNQSTVPAYIEYFAITDEENSVVFYAPVEQWLVDQTIDVTATIPKTKNPRIQLCIKHDSGIYLVEEKVTGGGQTITVINE